MFISSQLHRSILTLTVLLVILLLGQNVFPVAARSLAEPSTMTVRLIAPGSVAIGATLTYTVEVSNSTSASDVLLNINLPAGARYLSAHGDGWTCPPPAAPTETVVTCRRTSFPATGATPSTILINAIAPTTAGEIRTVAVVSEGGSERAHTEAVTTITTTSALADLQVELIAPAAVEERTPFIVEVRISNRGTSIANGVQLVANMDIYLSSRFTARQPADCMPLAWHITCNVGVIAPGGAVILLLEVEVPSHQTSVPFAATLSSATAESNLVNNTQSITIPVNRPAGEADVRIRGSQFSPLNPVTPGALVGYVMEPGNLGPQTANITNTLTVPAGFTILGTDSMPGWLCRTNTLTATCSGGVASIADYYRTAITVYALAPITPGAYTVNLNVTGDRADPLLANNRATINTEVAVTTSATADLAISTDVTPATPAIGSHVTYTVRVRNIGAANAGNVTVLAPVFEPDWIYSAEQSEWAGPAGWRCDHDNQNFLCHKETLTPAEGEQILVFHLLAPDTPGIYQDRVGVGSGTDDPNPANNVATASLTVAAGAPPAADLALNGITYEGAPHAVASGATVRVRLKLLNRGPQGAPNPYLLLRLPAGWSFVGTPSPSPWHCNRGVQTLECRRPTFAPTPPGSDGEEFVFEVVAPAVTSRTRYFLNAYFNSDAWNSFSFYEPYSSVAIWVSDRAANLRITANDIGHDPTNVGTRFRYEVHVRNIGSHSTAPVGVIADIPGNLILLRAVTGGRDLPIIRGPGWLWGFSSNEELPPGAETVITLYLQAPPTTGSATSRFTVYSGDTDTDLADNVAVEETTFTIGAITADLRLRRIPGAATVCAGAPFSYTLAVDNQGAEMARDLNLVETLPVGLNVSSAFSADLACTVGSDPLACRRDNLTVGPMSEVLVTGRAPTTPGLYRSYAGVSGSTADNNTHDNVSEFALTVTACTASYQLDWWTVDGGGQTFATGGSYTMGNTAGQPDAGNQSEGAFTLSGGFWYPVAGSRTEGIVHPDSGGAISHKGSSGIDLQLSFPSGATADPLNIVIDESAETDDVSLISVVGNVFSINAYRSDGSNVNQFSKSFVLTIQYDPVLLSGREANQLTLAFWDGLKRQWVTVPVTVDANTHTLRAELNHLTTFALHSPVIGQVFLPLVAR